VTVTEAPEGEDVNVVEITPPCVMFIVWVPIAMDPLRGAPLFAAMV
jgi:hypothetical protein